MVLIAGATGHLGTAVIEQLLKKTSADKIAAFVRDANKASDLKEKGIDIRVGNYDDTDSLDKAMQSVEKVLLISGGDAENGLEEPQNVVDAAKKAGVKCIGYTSRNMKDRNTLVNNLMKRHFQTEDYIQEKEKSPTRSAARWAKRWQMCWRRAIAIIKSINSPEINNIALAMSR